MKRDEKGTGGADGAAASENAVNVADAAASVPPDALARRARFPRGLSQPEGGFRFGADTLLLAAFAAGLLPKGKPLAGLDIGTGSGAASIALLLLPGMERLRLTGIDTSPEMLACARANAEALALAQAFTPLEADAAGHRAPRPLDFVLANPPFRIPGTGKACPDALREGARFEGPGGFAAFAACAGRNLRPGGWFFLVHLSERLPGLLADLASAGLATRRITPVQGRAEGDPRLMLLAATRRAPSSAAGIKLTRGLVLYGPDDALTPEALEFCPHLRANPRRNVRETAVQAG